VARNAATLPPSLVDAELFGHARNYPNPGAPERPGLIGQADGGTLFLDEIGEVSHEVQAHLLRVLDAGEYHRLGEATARRADLRLIAATNRADSELKHDLAARLPLRVKVPDLDERREDIPLLSCHLLRRARQANPEPLDRFFAGDHPRLDPALVDHLVRRPYTTHVRELDAILWRAMTASPSDVVVLPADLDAGPAAPPAAPKASRRGPSAEPTVDEIRAAARQNGGNLAQAARALGLANRYALYRLLKRHGIDPDALR
jgi:DNA-binding NtrC family response regulator